MPAAPRAANGSPSDPSGREASQRWPASRRLRTAAQFAAVTSDPQAIRAGRRWLSVAGSVVHEHDAAAPPVRFGFTASRRHARHAVERNTAKRVLREAARRHLAQLDAAAAHRRVDVVLRLKAGVPDRKSFSRVAWRQALRAEADALLAELARRLRGARADR
jgi:ribonuclease P protein component